MSADVLDEVLGGTAINAGYGKRQVLFDVDISLRRSETLCLVGHNGAGKSTLLRTLYGLHPVQGGELRLNGTAHRPAPGRMISSGVAFLPEGRGVFPDLTVREIFNLAFWSAAIPAAERDERREEVLTILPRIREFWDRKAGNLSGGQQQMVSIGRCLLSRPSVLILDEPSIGLAPKLFQDILDPLKRLKAERSISILIVEQNLDDAFAISDRVVVMRSGRIIRHATPAELSDRTALMELF